MPKKRKSNSQAGILNGDAPVLSANPEPEKSLRPKSKWWISLLIIFLLLYVAFNVGVLMYSEKTGIFASKLAQIFRPGPIPTPIPSPTPTPRPIPHGPMDFTVSQSDHSVPQMRNGHIDPYDPARGTTQTITISVKHSQPVTNVTAIVYTDQKISKPIPFALITGTATDGTWKGSWQVTDSYLFIYKLELHAMSGSKTGTVIITLR